MVPGMGASGSSGDWGALSLQLYIQGLSQGSRKFQFSTIEHAIKMQITFFESACISASYQMKTTISLCIFRKQ